MSERSDKLIGTVLAALGFVPSIPGWPGLLLAEFGVWLRDRKFYERFDRQQREREAAAREEDCA